jgi:hypothetical protein
MEGVTAATGRRVASPAPVRVMLASRYAPIDSMVCGASAHAR